MLDITLGGSDIKSLLTPQGAIQVVCGALQAGQPFSPSANQLLTVSFQAGPSGVLQLGATGSATLGITAKTSATLAVYTPQGDASGLAPFGLADYFTRNPQTDNYIMALTIGGDLGASASGQFQYAVLTAKAELAAGADAQYRLALAFPSQTPAERAVRDFFKRLQFPAALSAAPKPGDCYQMEYGGYLSLGASLGAGWSMTGSASHKISAIQLSENYGLKFLGKLSLGAKLAGRFILSASAGAQTNWARVRVTKSSNKNAQIAADINLSADVNFQGLPNSPNDFLEALLGLKAENWIHLAEKLQQLTNPQELKNTIDTLAQQYIAEYTGKAFHELENNEELKKAVAVFNTAVTDYQNLGNYAAAIFDRYYDPVSQTVSRDIQDVLTKITQYTSPDQLRGTLLGDKLADLVCLLTDGKPLDWLLGKIKIGGKELPGLEALQQRASNTLSLIRDDAHALLRKVITLAKSKFPLDAFLEKLKTIDPDQLNAETDAALTGFVERVVGETIDGLSKSKLGDVIKQVNDAFTKLDALKNNLYTRIKQSMDQSFQFGLALAYNKNTSNNALLDVDINLADSRGAAMMQALGAGDFSRIFENYDPAVLVIHEGDLTREVTEKSSVLLNIVGWHKQFKYQNIVTLLTQSEQCIRSETNGMLTVTTHFTMGMSRDMTRNGDRIYANLVIGMVGASKPQPVYDPETKRYLVDVLTKTSGNYTLEFNARNTRPDQLREFLEYAVQFGIKNNAEEVDDAIIPDMEKDAAGNFGSVSLDYQVRFNEAGLNRLFTQGLPDQTMRTLIRKLTWSNYLNCGKDYLRRIGWVYLTNGVYDLWKQTVTTFYNSSTQFSPIDPAPVQGVPSPQSVLLYPPELQLLNTIYNIEDSIVSGMERLIETVQQGGGFSPQEYEDKLGDFEHALNSYDGIDESVNTLFAVFDAFIRAIGQPAVQASVLTLKSRIDNRPEMTKILMS